MYILIIRQALYFGERLENDLLNPFQCRLNGVGIKKCPRILDSTVNDDSHSMLFPNNDLKIPLRLNGTVSYFSSRQPTKEEFDRCPHIELTAPEPEWNPHNEAYSRGEACMTGDDGNILRRKKPNILTREIMGAWTATNMAKSDDPFLEQLEQCVRVSSVQSSVHANATTPGQLANR
jgi:hypothetical protein